jgi:hypothetical protein
VIQIIVKKTLSSQKLCFHLKVSQILNFRFSDWYSKEKLSKSAVVRIWLVAKLLKNSQTPRALL